MFLGSETLHEGSPPTLRSFFVPQRDPFCLRESKGHRLGVGVTLMLRPLVGVPRVRNGVDLCDCMGRGMLAKSALNDDIFVSCLH